MIYLDKEFVISTPAFQGSLIYGKLSFFKFACTKVQRAIVVTLTSCGCGFWLFMWGARHCQGSYPVHEQVLLLLYLVHVVFSQ